MQALENNNIHKDYLTMKMGSVSILQIFLYYLYKALHNDTLPTEIITDSINN